MLIDEIRCCFNSFEVAYTVEADKDNVDIAYDVSQQNV